MRLRIAKGQLMNFMLQEDSCIDALSTLTLELRLLEPEVDTKGAANSIRVAMTDDNGLKRYMPCELTLDIGGER